MVFEKIAALIADHVGCDIADIKEESTFEALGIDSLDTAEMVIELEEELGIEIQLKEKMETVGQLAKYIESQKG